MPRRRNAAFVAITPDLDLTEPAPLLQPPSPNPSRVSGAGIVQGLLCFPCLHPEPQKVNIRGPAHFWLLFVSLRFVFDAIHLSLYLSHTNTHMCIPHSCKQKKPRLRHIDRAWSCVVCARKNVQECVKHSLASNYQQLQKLWNRYYSFYSVRAL